MPDDPSGRGPGAGPGTSQHDPVRRYLTGKVLEPGSPRDWPAVFRQEVLNRYLRDGNTIWRTDNAGHLQLSGRRSLRFGIQEEAGLIQLTVGELLDMTSPEEREHWLAHLVLPPVNEAFLRMQMRGGCVSDGDLRPWDPTGEGAS